MLDSRTKLAEFVPYRLRQARKAKAWTMSRLADEVRLTRQAISQFEKGESKPSPDKLREMAHVLDQPEQFFTWPLVDIEYQKQSPATFRSMVSSLARAREQAETWLELLAATVGVLRQRVDLPPVALPSFDIEDFTKLTVGDIEGLALSARKHFGLGNGPISNLTLLLENKGVAVAFKKLSKGLSGLSQWFDGRPFVIIDPQSSAARARYSLAHELGHLTLHRQLSSDSELLDKDLLRLIEHQANYFASAFMLPEESIASEMYALDWAALIELKSRWRMSIAAIVMRLHAIGLIGEAQRTRLFREISSRNARLREPLDGELQQDYPRLINRITELLDSEAVMSRSDLSRAIRYNIKLISELGQIPLEKLGPKVIASNVISLRRVN